MYEERSAEYIRIYQSIVSYVFDLKPRQKTSESTNLSYLSYVFDLKTRQKDVRIWRLQTSDSDV